MKGMTELEQNSVSHHLLFLRSLTICAKSCIALFTVSSFLVCLGSLVAQLTELSAPWLWNCTEIKSFFFTQHWYLMSGDHMNTVAFPPARSGHMKIPLFCSPQTLATFWLMLLTGSVLSFCLFCYYYYCYFW